MTVTYHPGVSPAPPRDSAAISPRVRAYLEQPRFAVVATINPDGSPHTAVVWYLLDDDAIVINSAEGRRWPSNLRRDPRISVAVEDGLYWVSLRGEVEIIDDQPQAQADIAAMAYRYESRAEAERIIRDQFTRQQRVSFMLRPTSVHAELEGD